VSRISYAFYEWNEEKPQLTIVQFAKRVQNEFQDDILLNDLKCHLNLSQVRATCL